MKIAKIEYTNEEKDVYDIRVPEKHHYVANGIVSHNSAMASQLAIGWSRLGHRVVFVPLEMSKIETTGRILANVSEIDIRKILLKRLTSEEKQLILEKYKKFVKRNILKGGRYTLFKPPQDMTIEEVLSVAAVYGPKIVIIDYVGLLKMGGSSEKADWQKLGDIARYCKIYAAANDVLVVLLAQVNEDGKLKYSQTMREHADYAWFFVATKETRENEILNVEQVKGRNAELFPFSLRARLDVMRIGDMSREDIEATQTKKKKPSTAKEMKQEDYIDDIAESE